MAPNLRELILEREVLGSKKNILIRCRHLRLLDITGIKDVAVIKVEKDKTFEEVIVVRGSSKAKVSIFEIE